VGGVLEQTLITDEMRAAVGKTYRVAGSYPIAASDIRRWAMAVYFPARPPPLYWDEEHAKTTRWGGIVAPEEFNPFAWMRAYPGWGETYPDLWPEPHLGIEPPPTRANIVTEIGATYTGTRMRPGDVIRSELALNSYQERRGRLGLMLFTETKDRWFNQHGELIRTFCQTFIRYGEREEALFTRYAGKSGA